MPISTYGASKLAGEALISAYCSCSGSRAACSASATSSARGRRTASGFDFVRRLLADPTRLAILGDGSQSKSYVHVDDVIDAVLARARAPSRPRSRPSTSRPATTSRSRRSPTSRSRRSGSTGRASRFEYTGGDRAGRATCRSCASRSSGCAASGGRRPHLDGGAARLDGGARRCDPRRPAVSAAARAVFLDRDGVLIRAPVVDGLPRSIRSVEELELEHGAVEVVHGASSCRLPPGRRDEPARRARGLLSRETVDAMHARLAELLPLDDIRVCPHDDADGCECRKPKPGMLVEAAREHGIALERSFMVGDRRNDVEAVAPPAARASSSTGSTVSACRTVPTSSSGISGKPSPGSSRRAIDDDRRRSEGQDLRRRRRPRTRPGAVRRAVDPRLHDEPDADAQGRRGRLRVVRPRAPRARPGPADLLRGLRRRARRDRAPGAADRVLGRERLREGSGHDHARRADGGRRSAAFGERRSR